MPPLRSRLATTLVRLPDRLVLIYLALLIAVAVTASSREFHWWLTLPLFAGLAALLWRGMPHAPRIDRANLVGSGAAVLMAIVWVVVNVPFQSQLVWATRDPGVYTVDGLWLWRHPSPLIDQTQALALAHGVPNVVPHLGAFAANPASGLVQLQGGVLLPGMLGVGGWVDGVGGVLSANIVLGGVLLLAVYGLSRRFMGPIAALVPELAFALSVAVIYLARAPYSEVIMAAVCAAGLMWLIQAVREGRPILYAVSGLFLGIAGFVRIDGALAVIGALIAIALGVFLQRDVDAARKIRRGAWWFAATAAVALVASAGSLAYDERSYLHALLHQAIDLWGGLAVVAAITLVCLLVRPLVGAIPERSTKVLAVAASAIVVAGFAVLVSRPLWFHPHYTTGGAYIKAIAGMQTAQGLPVDGTRSYDEYTMNWVGWYFGWPTVVLAIIGLAVVVYLAFRRRSIPLLLLAGTTLTAAALYLNRVDVTPDQVWAYRRLLPLITTGFVVSAAFAAWRWTRLAGWRRVVALVALVALGFGPLLGWNSLLGVSDETNEVGFAQSICAKLDPDKPAVLITDGAPANYALTIRTLCNVPLVSATSPTAADLDALRAREPGIQAIVFSPTALPSATPLPAPQGAATIIRWNSALTRIPTTTVTMSAEYWVGTLGPDGTFVLAG